MPKFVVKYSLSNGQDETSPPQIDMYDAVRWTFDHLRPSDVTKLSIEPVEPRRLTLREIVVLLRKCQNDFLYRNISNTDTGTKLSDMINFIEVEVADKGVGLNKVVVEEGE